MSLQDCCTVTLAAIAACTDVVYGKVYNATTYPAILVGFALALFVGSPKLSDCAYGAIVTFIVYYALHRWCGLGAGDVKLMTGVGAIKGLAFVAFASFYIMLFASIGGLIFLVARGRLLGSLKWVFLTIAAVVIPGVRRPALPTGRTGVPFAPFVLIGIAYSLFLESAYGKFTLSG